VTEVPNGLRQKLGQKTNPIVLPRCGNCGTSSPQSLFKDHQHQLDAPLSAEKLPGLTAYLRSL